MTLNPSDTAKSVNKHTWKEGISRFYTPQILSEVSRVFVYTGNIFMQEFCINMQKNL